jgi:integrase
LTFAQKTNTCARDGKISADTSGLLAQFYAYLEKEGFCGGSQYPNNIKRLAKYGANLRDPESVKAVIGAQKVKDGMKMNYVYAYGALAAMLEIKWNPPKYRQEEIIPFIPYESELDALICACKSRRIATYLQCIKETYGDPTEVLRIKWIYIDEKERTIKINYPVKNHLPRTLEVSAKLLSMINSLPKTQERIFTMTYPSLYGTYTKMRRRVASMQQNPRILSIELRTFRHWGGTMIAHYTNGNVLMVKKLLGHKRVENSMKYIGMIDFKNDDFEVATATTVEEITKLGIAGWVKYDEINFNGTQMHFYKKPKRFAKYAT